MPPTFADLGVPADVSSALSSRGIIEPFPIQAATIPDALAGHDVCGKAPTGSGKTLAFGLALVLRVERARPRLPRGLVLVPTRELASQVASELEPLARARGLRVVAIYGGASMENQRKLLNRGADIVVATPGRLEDFLERRTLGLDDVSVAVLDEADRMADMGFTPAVQRILDATRPDRQILLFSATLDGDVDKLVKRYLNKPRRHDVVGNDDDKGDVVHLFWRSRRDERVEMTANIVDRHERAIVFCRTRHGAERLAKQLAQAGVGAAAIHGARSQSQRERALADFKTGRVKALVATDVAARGIHVDAVPCVIHFDPPADHKDYTHRSGRTGRAGATGVVVSLVGDEHRGAVKTLQRSLGFPSQVDPADRFPVRTAKPIVAQHRPEPSRPGDRARNGKPARGHSGGQSGAGYSAGGSSRGGAGGRSGGQARATRSNGAARGGYGGSSSGAPRSPGAPGAARSSGAARASGSATSGSGSGAGKPGNRFANRNQRRSR